MTTIPFHHYFPNLLKGWIIYVLFAISPHFPSMGKCTLHAVPAGWKFPLDVLITKISGHGTCRDVEIECYVTMEDRLANGIERGTLLFWDDINAELRFDQQALRQGPVRHIGQGTPEVNQWDVDT
jgi:hypothetical protein